MTHVWWSQSPVCPSLACRPLNAEVPPFFRIAWPSVSGKVTLLPVRAGTKPASLCLWSLSMSSSKARVTAPTWICNVTAQNGQGDQTLPAESRLHTPQCTRTPTGAPFTDPGAPRTPWEPQHSLHGWTTPCASWEQLMVTWTAWLTLSAS